MNKLDTILENANLTEDIQEDKKGAEYQYARFNEIMHKSRIKFTDDMVFKLGIAQKRMKIYFYNAEIAKTIKYNSPKRAMEVREFFYQDKIRNISDKEYLKRLLKSCADLIEIDTSY